MSKIPLIIDCDPGVDDALAIILANTKSCFELKAITSVAGNVPVETTTHNLQLLKSLLGLTCPIARGEAKPLVKKQVTAANTHGNDGLGGYAHCFNDIKPAPLSELSAVQLMAKVLSESDDKVVIAAIGPLTNLALVIKAYPHLTAKIARLAIMGGGLSLGNITPSAEFNFYVDPEAAQIVFNSTIPIVLAALDVTLQADILAQDIERFKAIDNKVAMLATTMLASYAAKDAALHDPVAILAISDPDLFTTEGLFIQIETNEGATRAMSFADKRGRELHPDNCLFLNTINREKFIDEIETSLKYYG